MSNYKTIDGKSPMRANKHYNPTPLRPVMNKNLMMHRHASTLISRNYANSTLPLRNQNSFLKRRIPNQYSNEILDINTGGGSTPGQYLVREFELDKSSSQDKLVKGQMELPRITSVQSIEKSIVSQRSHHSSASYSSTKSRYMQPPANQQSNMNPELKSILTAVNSDIF